MKRIIQFIILILAAIFQGCMGTDPKKDEMVGKWVSSDGATLSIDNEGTFRGEALPAEHFSFYANKKDVTEKKVSGAGKWRLEKGQRFWEIKLDFEEINGVRKGGSYFVLVSGSTGILENNPPWYLFEWVEDEGGQRYKFERK